MTSEELADEVEATIRFCREGITGVGHEQYAIELDGVELQHFETLPLESLIQYAREEARDLVNYGVMLDIRLRALQEALHK